MEVSPEIQKAWDKAKLTLIMRPNTVFYTTLLFSLKFSWNDQIDTAGTDGIHLEINPNWFMKLTPGAQIGLLIHEVLHVSLDHMTRKGDRDPDIWNIAGDHVINLSITKSGYALPPNPLCEPKYSRMSTEQLYEILYAESQKQLPSGGIPAPSGIPGIGKDIIYPAPGQQNEEVKAEITQKILKAATQSKLANEDPGCIPGDILIQLEKILNPKLPWNVILRNHFTEICKDDYSMRRPNRKFMPDFYLPSAHSDAVANLVFALDGSGSVRPKQFSYFIAEAGVIQQYLRPEKMTMVVFDTEITGIHDITNNTNLLKDVEFKAGGGTEIQPVFNWANKNIPKIMLIFTDGYMRVPSIPPVGVSIIWLIHNNPKFTAPYGEVIHYDI